MRIPTFALSRGISRVRSGFMVWCVEYLEASVLLVEDS